MAIRNAYIATSITVTVVTVTVTVTVTVYYVYSYVHRSVAIFPVMAIYINATSACTFDTHN